MGLSSAATRLELKRPAAAAAVDDGPFPALAHPDRDRVHDPAAVGCPVAGLEVDVEAGEAVGTVVAVVTPCVLRGAEPPADLAGKAVIAGMGLIIAFFRTFCVCFPDSWWILLKIES